MDNKALKLGEESDLEVTSPGPVTRALEESVAKRRRNVKPGKITVNRPSGLSPEWTIKVQNFQVKMSKLITPEEKKTEMDKLRREEPDLFQAMQISLSLGTSAVREQLSANEEELMDAHEVDEIIADARLKAVSEVGEKVVNDLKKVG